MKPLYCGIKNKRKIDIDFEHIKKISLFWKMSNSIKKMGKKKIIISMSIFVVALIVLISGCAIYNNDYNRAIRYYKASKPDKIQELYCDINDSESSKLYNYLEKQAQTVRDNYVDGKITYDEASNMMNEISKSFKNTLVLAEFNKLNGDIQTLNDSRKNFDDAEEYYPNNDYEKAYECYSKVIQSDTNYSSAQSRINEIKPLIAEKYFTHAQQLFDSQDYLSALNEINTALSYDSKSEYTEFKQKCSDANDKANQEKAAQERTKKVITAGKVITTTQLSIEYENASFTSRILPTNTSGAYSYQKCPDDSIFLDIVFNVKNTSDYNAGIDFVKSFTTTYGTKQYTMCSEFYSEPSSTTLSSVFSSTNIAPLKSVTFHVTVKLPYEATKTGDSITVSFEVGNQDQLLEFR